MAKPKDRRAAELGRIHILKKDLGLDEDQYRAMLWTVGRVESSRDLDSYGRQAVIDHLTAHARLAGKLRAAPQRPSGDKAKLTSKVRALLMDAQPPRDDAYADGIARQMFGVERFTWCAPVQLRKLIAALEIDKRRRAAKA